ncbi:MAG: CBS domain-containing protein [Rhizobiales bacterium]|nr:CBS domain-containing protein [Hyphomicrobiales bacterium]
MKASDVMTTNVVTVPPDATVQAAAEIMLKRGISGLPVISKSGELAGIVSEGDLVRRVEAGTEHKRMRWLDLIARSETLAAEFVKAHGRKVADVMTRRVITAPPNSSLAEIADLIERNHIKRVPIVDGGKIVGIVSRANLMQAIASAKPGLDQARNVNDESLRKSIVDRLWAQAWSQPSQINVIVQKGVVDLWGFVDTETAHKAVRVLAEETPGVRAVNDNIRVQVFSGI